MTVTYHKEEWRVIEDFPVYAVSSLGNVKRVVADMRNHKITGIPLKPGLSQRGYPMVSLCFNGRITTKRINRLVCEAFHGSPPTIKHHAAHNDGDVSNNMKNNLRWATPSENESDKTIHGTRNIGERHSHSKLTANDVVKIRSDERSQREIAADFGVSQFAIWSIKSRDTWRHVP